MNAKAHEWATGSTALAQTGFGTVAGGVAEVAAGGNFWHGAAVGLTASLMGEAMNGIMNGIQARKEKNAAKAKEFWKEAMKELNPIGENPTAALEISVHGQSIYADIATVGCAGIIGSYSLG
jgi:hypothetical protein